MSPLCTGIHCSVNVQRQRKDELKDLKILLFPLGHLEELIRTKS